MRLEEVQFNDELNSDINSIYWFKLAKMDARAIGFGFNVHRNEMCSGCFCYNMTEVEDWDYVLSFKNMQVYEVIL